MKKTYITVGILLFFAVCTLTFYNQHIVASDEKVSTAAVATSSVQEGKMISTSSKASFETNYDSVEKLVSKSTVIVEGEVVGLDYFDFNTNTFTKAKIKVSKSFTDAVKAGDVVTFVDAGGITTLDKLKLNKGSEGKPGTTPITEKDKNTKVQALIDGCPLLKLNDKVVFFGVEDKEDFFKLSEKYYDLIGSHQGKFTFKGDIAERYSSEGISSLKLAKLDLEEKIKNSVAKIK